MKYGIGLDIGITSIGWATLALDENESPFKIDKLGCRIFDIAENPRDGSSLALPRREARSSRRRLRRRRHRIERMKQLFVDEKMLSQEKMDSLYDGENADIYCLRTEALDRKVTNEEFAKILLHIAKRRGFKSNRRSEKNDKEAGKLLTAVSENESKIAEKGYRTIGEMLYKDEAFAENKRNKGENYLNTVSRKMVEEEVRLIFKQQKQFEQEFATEDFCEKYLGILLSQRSFEAGPGLPSKYAGNQIEKMLGKCVFEKEEYRAAKAEYHTQYGILLENINHMRIVSAKDSRSLSENERKALICLAFNSRTLNYTKIRKKLGLSEKEFFSSLSYGNKAFDETEKKAKFEYLKAYHTIKNALEKCGEGFISRLTEDQLDEIGRGLTLYKSEESLKAYLEKFEIDVEIIDAVLGISSFSGFSNISRKAYKKIIPFLEQSLNYDKACLEAGYDFRAHSGNEKTILLPATGEELDDITNPVVRRAISQTIKVVNAIIREYGESPVYINIELARELSKDHDERSKIDKKIKENTEKNSNIMERLKNEFGISNPTGQDLIKFKLWQEQDGICPYSLEALEITRLFEPGYADIDHIIPYSKCFDDSYKNKVVVKASENREKGNRVPLQYLSGEKRDKFAVWVGDNIRDLKKRQKLLKESFTEEDREQFIERNLNDTKYISRFMLNYVKDHLVFAPSEKGKIKRVFAVNGAVTSYLRKRWGINKIRENGDAHHIVDAAVIACATDGIIKRVSDYSKYKEVAYIRNSETESDIAIDRATGEILKGFPEPWTGFRNEVLIRSECADPAAVIREKKLLNYMENDLLFVKPVFVSRMPKHKATGAAHEATVSSPKLFDEGYLVQKKALSTLKLNKDGEIDGYYNPDSDRLLYNALIERLKEFGGDGAKAFTSDNPFYKPKSDGTRGPLVKKVKIMKKATLGVSVYNGNGVADNDSMLRIDVFYVAGEGYYWIPVYVADTLKKELPNKAVVAFKPQNEWKEMKDENFIFSLYPSDLIKFESKKPPVFKIISKESTLPTEKTENDCFAYFVSAGINTGSISVINHDKTYTIASLGVKTLLSLEKYQVDVLGKVSKVGKEPRLGFGK